MKILMINVVCGIRSTGRFCTDLAEILEELGHEVKIAYGRENVPKNFERFGVKIGNTLTQNLHGIRARLFDGAGFGSTFTTKKFVDWIKEFDPDIIHLHNVHGYYINISVLFNYLRTCGKKIIWTLHDCWSFTGHCAILGNVECEKWRSGCYSCPQKKEYPKSYVDGSQKNWERKKKLFTKIPNMTIVTPSRWLAGLVAKSFLAEYSIVTIHNGIDTRQFFPFKSYFKEKYKVDDKFLLLGVASAWNKSKGLDDFIKLAEYIEDDCKIVLVGLDKKQVAMLPPSILAITKTDSVQELAEIYNGCDLFLNLTYADNYPTVNIEALACNIPVLTYNTGGSAESITKENGRVIKTGDLDAVLKCVKEYKRSWLVDEKVDIKDNNDRYDKKYAVEQYIKLIQQV